jgi:hypothetical protein
MPALLGHKVNGWPPPASTASLALTLLFHNAVLPEDQRHAQHIRMGLGGNKAQFHLPAEGGGGFAKACHGE